MIQTRNQYLQFMLVMLAAWGISWGARFVMSWPPETPDSRCILK